MTSPTGDGFDHQGSRMSRSNLLSLLPLPFFAFVIFAVGVVAGVRDQDDLVMLGIAALMLAAAPAPILATRKNSPGQRHLFFSFFAIAFVAHYSLPVFTYYLPADGPVDAPAMARSNLLPRDVIRGQLAALLGYVVLLAAYFAPATRAMVRALPRLRRDWAPQVGFAVAFVLIPIGWTITFFGQIGAVPAILGTGFIGVFAVGHIYANGPLTILILRERWRAPAVLLLLNVTGAFLWGIMTGRKLQILIAPAIVVLTAAILRDHLRPRWVLLGALAVAVVFPVSNFVKNELGGLQGRENVLNPAETLGMVADFATSANVDDYLANGFVALGRRFDGLGVTSVLVRDTPSESPYQLGRTLGLFFIAPIPRALWPDKPRTNIGGWITAVYGSGPQIRSSTGPTQVGEWYVNFGWLGIIAGMALLGLFLRIVQETLLSHPATMPGILIGLAILQELIVKFQGSVAGAYSYVLFMLVPIVGFHWVLRAVGGTRLLDAEPPPRGQEAGHRVSPVPVGGA